MGVGKVDSCHRRYFWTLCQVLRLKNVIYKFVLFVVLNSLFGAMFPLPRIIYAMGSDGLVFKFLAKVHPKFQSPVVGTLLAGLLTGNFRYLLKSDLPPRNLFLKVLWQHCLTFLN